MMDVFVYVANLPVGVNSCVAESAEGYTVYVNSALSSEEQQKAYQHEIAHIKEGDMQGDIDVNEVEIKRHCDSLI